MSTKSRHDIAQLRACGKRVVNALRTKQRIPDEDVQLLPDIIDFNQAQALRVMLLYVIPGAILTALAFCVEWLFEWDFEATFPPIFIVLFAAFAIHFTWSSSAGRDCYGLQISNLLKCKSCRRNISGNMIHRLAESSKCPFCNVPLDDVFGSNINTKE